MRPYNYLHAFKFIGIISSFTLMGGGCNVYFIGFAPLLIYAGLATRLGEIQKGQRHFTFKR